MNVYKIRNEDPNKNRITKTKQTEVKKKKTKVGLFEKKLKILFVKLILFEYYKKCRIQLVHIKIAISIFPKFPNLHFRLRGK